MSTSAVRCRWPTLLEVPEPSTADPLRNGVGSRALGPRIGRTPTFPAEDPTRDDPSDRSSLTRPDPMRTSGPIPANRPIEGSRMPCHRLRTIATTFLLIASCAGSVYAQLTTTNLVRYQVLQRAPGTLVANHPDSGSCTSGTSRIQIRLQDQGTGATIASFDWKDLSGLTISGTKWKGIVEGLPVGGEYKAQLRSLDGAGNVLESSTTVENLLVGDIWLCAGQSNMMGQAGTTLNTAKVHTRILWDAQPGTKETAGWGTTLAKGPSTSFANRLAALTGIPVGIIYAAQGGTSLYDWFYKSPTNIFASMDKFMKAGPAGWNIGGFLWYQGENEDQQDTWALRYFTKFSLARERIRARSGLANLPTVIVQLESWDGVTDYPLAPYSRWIRWPIIRDQQELAGRADAYSVAAPIWTQKGIHINGAGEALLGTYCAAKAARKFYGSVISDPGAGPEFRAAWFKDSSRKDIVVQFQGVKGKLVNPADPNHLGFYVMDPKVFAINDSTIFSYLKDSKGNPAKMLKAIASTELLDDDKVVIHLSEAAMDSVTVGYGRHIQLTSLQPLTDDSGVPVLTFFNRVVAATPGPTGLTSPARPAIARIHLTGRTLRIDYPTGSHRCEIGIFNLEGKRLFLVTTTSESVDLSAMPRQGPVIAVVRYERGPVVRTVLPVTVR